MKILDIFEKLAGTLYILAAVIPLPFSGQFLFGVLRDVGFPLVDQYYFFYILPISITFLGISLILTKKVDLGQMRRGRRIRKLFYITLIIAPVIILIMKIIYPQGSFHMGI